MALLLSPETYRSLEKKLGEKETQELVGAVDATLQEVRRQTDEKLAKVTEKADYLISQKKFELKDELTKELVTKADFAELRAEFVALRAEVKAEIARLEYKLDRKFTLMFYTLLFVIIFLNQNALEFIAKLLRLM